MLLISQVKQFIQKVAKQRRPQLYATVDSKRRSALHIASKEGYEALLQYLLGQGFLVNGRDRQLKTALHEACIADQEGTCRILIESKSDLTARDNKQEFSNCRGATALHYAVGSTSSKIVSELVEKNARLVDCKDASGKTPLHYAVMSSTSNQVDILRVLIEAEARVNEKDSAGRTPLHYAAEAGKSRALPILLKNKGNIMIKDSSGRTVVDLASNDRVKKILRTYSS